MRHSSILASCSLLLATLTSGCDLPRAWGEWNSIIVGTSAERWAEMEDAVYAALEPRVRIVRDEKTFKVTQQDPREQDWAKLRRFRQLLLIGTADEPWMAEALATLERTSFDPPEILDAEDVWAKGQSVTIVLLSDMGGVEEVTSRLEPLHEMFDSRYRRWVIDRMFMTRRDTALADTLVRVAGFRLTVPEVYQWRQEDSVYMFRNDNPDPAELIRQVTVTWRDGGAEDLHEAEIVAWREEVEGQHYSYPQVVDTSTMLSRRVRLGDMDLLEVQAIWANPPEDFPAAGPFITRVVGCPAQDRTYLVDAWLYAPGKDKYQYMIQLETILDSFRCGGMA